MTHNPAGRSSVISILAFLCIILAFPASAYDVHAAFYEMDVRCVPEEARIEATARIGLREAGKEASSIHFWLHGELRVAAVRANGVKLEISQKREYYRRDYSLIGNHVEARLPGGRVPDSIDVEWSGFMNPSKARSPSDYMRIDETGVFLRALGYSPWFPILLEPDEDEHNVDFRRVSVEVPKALTAVFAGDLVVTKNDGELTRYVWRAENLSLFSAQLTARPFVVASEGDIRVYTLRDETSIASGTKILDLTRSLLQYFADHYSADAVSGQAHIAEMTKYGDISSGNVVGIQEERWRSFNESASSKRTLAHELVHPFVHPMISSSDPLYALVIEGFPSFYHYPALNALGAIDYNKRISAIRESYLKKRETGKSRRGRPLPPQKAISEITADEIRVYKDVFILSDRAVLFLDDLRTRMGESAFEAFNRELFAMKKLDNPAFRAQVLKYLPGFEEDLTIWLDTSELPRALMD